MLRIIKRLNGFRNSKLYSMYTWNEKQNTVKKVPVLTSKNISTAQILHDVCLKNIFLPNLGGQGNCRLLRLCWSRRSNIATSKLTARSLAWYCKDVDEMTTVEQPTTTSLLLLHPQEWCEVLWCVCLSVCSQDLENCTAKWPIFYMHVDCVRGSVRYDGIVLCYVLTVLWMMSCFHTMGPMD